MIGSRRRTILLKNMLEEKGISRELLDSIYTPIGLDIGAVTPEEIAIAIMAEIISVKSKMKQNFGYSREMLKAILDPARSDENMILLTIISRRGSTPRGVGSRMLVLADGSTEGTIGGGCAESDAIQKALFMLRTGDRETHIHRVDMSGSVVEDEGMVCGGMIDVLMESI
jgi:xanthine dehydrogenase accessory factor